MTQPHEGEGNWAATAWYLARTNAAGEEGEPDALIISGGQMAPLAGMQTHTCPGPVATEGYPLTVPFLTHEELVDRFMLFLDEQFCSLYGRAYDIYSESGRRECAEFLANATEGALAL